MTKWHTGKPTDRQGWYLVSFREKKSDPYDFAEIDIARYLRDGSWWIKGYGTDGVVDAWMPLPEPYHPEVNDGDGN